MHPFGEFLDMLDWTFVCAFRVDEDPVKQISRVVSNSILYFDFNFILKSILADQISHDVGSVNIDLDSHNADLFLGVC